MNIITYHELRKISPEKARSGSRFCRRKIFITDLTVKNLGV